VTTENPGGTGAYTAAVWSADDYAALVSVTPGAVAVDGSLSSADAYNPFFLPGESLRHDQYRLDLSGVTAGVPVEVTMSSTLSRTALDEVLMLVDAETGRWFGIGNDDRRVPNQFSTTNPNEVIHFLPIPGVHYTA